MNPEDRKAEESQASIPQPVRSEPPVQEEWRDIAEKASHEQDPRKLLKLVDALCDTLDQRAAAQKQKPPIKP